MKNSFQVSLYLKEGSKYKEDELANRLKKAVPTLNDPMIMSENANFPAEANAPILAFIKNGNLQFIGNYYFITINISGDDIKNYRETFKSIISSLEGLEFYRIGYVVSRSFEKKYIEEVKNKVFNQAELKNSNDFELSWLQEIEINAKKVNCWKRYFTDRNTNEMLNVIIDINTHEKEENEVTQSFIEKFIEESDKYIENNLSFINGTNE